MQPSGIFVYVILLTITVTETYASAERQEKGLQITKKNIRLNRRDATLLIDNFPMETVYQKPKLIYRRVSRISKHRYGPPKPKYGPPRPKYGPPKITRKPGKKYRGKNASPKYNPLNYKKYTTKPKFASSKRPKPVYGSPSRTPHFPIHPPALSGFAEPPSSRDDYLKSNQDDIKVDSYGSPVKSILKDLYPTLQVYKSTQNVDNDDFEEIAQGYQSWKNLKSDQTLDNIHEYSKKHPVYKTPEPDVFVTPVTPGDNEETINSYSDIIYDFKETQKKKEKQKEKEKKKKPFYPVNLKFVNRPWKPQKPNLDEEIIVGGQYAEPPARYMSKKKPDMPMFDDDEFIPPESFIDSQIPSSATNSPYVNYRNSNLAFSPQNLNDAFSIVD